MPFITSIDSLSECKCYIIEFIDLNERKRMYIDGKVPIEDQGFKKLLI